MICPNCIEKLQEKRIKAGNYKGIRVFLVCGKCGYNVPKASIKYYEEQERELFEKARQKDEDEETINEL